jgi:hypothetical protein
MKPQSKCLYLLMYYVNIYKFGVKEQAATENSFLN